MKRHYILPTILAVSLLFSFSSTRQAATVDESIQPFQDTWALPTKTYQTVPVDWNASKDKGWAIQLALNEAKNAKTPVKIVIPNGTYVLNKPLRIYSNTYLKLSADTTIVRNHNETMLINGDYGASYSGYTGQSNIVIDGGTWDANGDVIKDDGSVFGLSHGQNLLIQRVHVKDVYYSHAIDLSGDQNVVVRNSSFQGFYDDGTRGYAEAIQIDVTASTRSFSEFGSYDNTASRNVRIENNVFGSSASKDSKPWGVAIGSHSVPAGKTYTNIQVIRNTFDNVAVAVKGYGWENVKVYGNTIKATKYAVYLGNDPDMKTSTTLFSVRDNQITMTSLQRVSIRIQGQPLSLLTQVYIENNTFDHVKAGQRRAFWENAPKLFFGENAIK